MTDRVLIPLHPDAALRVHHTLLHHADAFRRRYAAILDRARSGLRTTGKWGRTEEEDRIALWAVQQQVELDADVAEVAAALVSAGILDNPPPMEPPPPPEEQPPDEEEAPDFGDSSEPP
jgi:hypothetical protein